MTDPIPADFVSLLPVNLDVHEGRFRDSELQASLDRVLARVGPGHSEVELDFHAAPGPDGIEASAHVIGAQRSKDGHFEITEVLGVRYRANKLAPEAGFRLRWSA